MGETPVGETPVGETPDGGGPVAGEASGPPGPPAGEARGGGPRHGTGRRHVRRGVLRRHPWRTAVAAVVVVLLALVGAAAVWLDVEANPGPHGPATIVTVRPGQSVSAITATLVRQQVVGSSLAFRLYLLVHGTPLVRPGGYALYRRDSFGQVRAALAHGPDVYPVVVYAGFTVREVAQEVGDIPGHDANHFLTVAGSGAVRSPYQPAGSTSLDGLLGPGQYRVVPGESDQALLGQMVDRFDATAAQVGLPAGAAALGVTAYQAVTIASIVQKEGVYSQNIGKVARVIYNRLARGMPLQMDSTVLYAENRDGGPVTPADLALQTPYNTYLHSGLTPTPICFPSTASLRAALAPTPGDWLYFVVVAKDGTEAFSDTLAGQQANEALAKSRGLG